ncbi:hypothetical protein, unlikely [Trypanosoma brucei gambiense DAL972]|uniref:Uncharacterized protein n=1 Tax=Trypanosoma brucei gambiense (strain MHOM/CI/86/DAL972) TaxID=679716 RepID=D0A8I1_TRYB9|nr:hypothetical protein, unlikely [Trypanosoma brucei gambiense DAL972]CBH17982.1 hypothetical protein, unlikely [Trypanosoma brucei gambiense DAL972]|eukprot:XP_011780246.1 hypothetical protein, unlikely [Trypanosoma brucei gambiense DAL972]
MNVGKSGTASAKKLQPWPLVLNDISRASRKLRRRLRGITYRRSQLPRRRCGLKIPAVRASRPPGGCCRGFGVRTAGLWLTGAACAVALAVTPSPWSGVGRGAWGATGCFCCITA